jgi:hypothetical protein
VAKYTHADLLDLPLTEIKTTGVVLRALSGLATDAAGAVSASLADVTIDSADYTGPAAGDGASGSRKVTVAAQSLVSIDVSGTATHFAILTAADAKLLHCGTCTSIVLTAGQDVNFPAFDIEFSAPTA